jgi:hypothetical protein
MRRVSFAIVLSVLIFGGNAYATPIDFPGVGIIDIPTVSIIDIPRDIIESCV